jgi:hypothetical protein
LQALTPTAGSLSVLILLEWTRVAQVKMVPLLQATATLFAVLPKPAAYS